MEFTRFSRWQMAGVWEKVIKYVFISPDQENIMIDPIIVRVLQNGVGAKRRCNIRLLDALRME
ncbi:hypothetical protein ACPV3A_30010 [Paenibacillus sp. Dod16]|uniref:hypothetical protein n=1 Tax=unclassified Paenibacillus TaxID=185978 RepID=UPI0035C21A7D